MLPYNTCNLVELACIHVVEYGVDVDELKLAQARQDPGMILEFGFKYACSRPLVEFVGEFLEKFSYYSRLPS